MSKPRDWILIIMTASLWHLTGISAILLPRCLSHIRAIEKVESRDFQTSRDLAVRGPSVWWIEAPGFLPTLHRVITYTNTDLMGMCRQGIYFSRIYLNVDIFSFRNIHFNMPSLFGDLGFYVLPIAISWYLVGYFENSVRSYPDTLVVKGWSMIDPVYIWRIL